MSTTKSKTAQRRESIVNVIPQRTLVLSLDIAPEQYEIFDGLADSYNRMWGSLVSWCNNNHSINRTRMQKENYARLRAEYPELPSQFVCIAMRDAAGAVRSWNSNHPKRQWNLKASRRKKTINYDLRVMSLRGNLLSLSATRGEKRQRILLPDVPDWFDRRYPERSLNAAKLVLNPDGHSASIMLIYRLPQSTLVEQGDVLGVDLGQHSLFVDSRGGEISYSHMQGVKRRYAHNRKTLQEKGTRSAHRRLRAMRHREERFIRNTNHRASKQLANTPNVSVIAFEDLTYIRRQARKGTKTGRMRRNMLNQWPFSQLQEFTAYKAAQNGIRTVMIDPAYTSQKCNRCGYVDARNRDHARFDCLRCGHSDNADHNAALNIRDRAIQNLG
jgi:transposase, IS605 orfB family